MRVVLDSRTLLSDSPRGTGKAFLEVYRQLPGMCPDWEFILIHRNRKLVDHPLASIRNVLVQFKDVRGDRFNLWQSLQLPISARLAQADVLHCPANMGPPWSATPILVTIHDLIPIQPEFRTSSWTRWSKRVGQIAHRARFVTTPSDFSREQIINAFGIPEKKVISIPWAASSNCHPVRQRDALNQIRQNYGIEPDQPYVLAFGAEDPRKNTRRMLEAWSRLACSERADAVLLVIGLQESFRNELVRSLNLGDTESSVKLHGYVSEEDVPGLISGAEFLCFPTLYEGFGLPVLDAFACETAVMTSRNSSIPEVAGDAAMYVDPYSAESISSAMADLLRDEQARKQLVERGREQARSFSWQRCAQQYRDVLNRYA